jgi:hypothetical protein
MSGAIYVLKSDDQLVEMRQQGYLTEDQLQDLLARYPSLLAGDQVSPTSPRRWLFVKREAGLPGEETGGDRYSLDHLFFDQQAIPTIIEVKRSTDTRIRREVVGQMLDYAANAVVYLPIERIRAWFEDGCTGEGRDPADVMAESIGPEIDPETFWSNARTNLLAGRLRLVFVADAIPPELRRIVEFLNSQMDPTEVIAVEIQQYVGKDLKTLVPRVIGRTADAERAKSTGGGPRKQWDEASFFAAMSDKPEEAAVARKLMDWLISVGGHFVYGSGRTAGSANGQIDAFRIYYPILSIWTNGAIGLTFGNLKSRPVTSDPAVRAEWVRRLREVPALRIPPEKEDSFPSVPAKLLSRPSAFHAFTAAMDWGIDQIRAAEKGS